MVNEFQTPTVQTALNTKIIRVGVRASKTFEANRLIQIDKTNVKRHG
jgi:hypothetical protein